MSQNNQPQVALDFDLMGPSGEVGAITVAMSLAKNALPYTIERLRACGWLGKNILDLSGVDALSVLVDVFVQRNPDTGREQLRAEIVTGGGSMTFKLKNPIPPSRLDAFAAYVTRGIEAMPIKQPAPVSTTPPISTDASGEDKSNDEIPF